MCGSSARTDLYGGRPAMSVPTVTENDPKSGTLHLQIMQNYVPGINKREDLASSFTKTSAQRHS